MVLTPTSKSSFNIINQNQKRQLKQHSTQNILPTHIHTIVLLDFKEMLTLYDLTMKNVIHVGGHHGQELPLYVEVNPDVGVKIFEPHPDTYKQLCNNVSNHENVITCYDTALGSEVGMMDLHICTGNEGQSNSLLKPNLHVGQYPHIRFDGSVVSVSVMTLDSYNFDDTHNFMNIDVQGFELEVLKGSVETLKHIDFIIVEVNRAEVYTDCAQIEEIDEFLFRYGFGRVETSWDGGTWGDALYIK